MLALVGILVTPSASRARMFCRYSGIEITDCDEQGVPAKTAVQADHCCERRVVPALGLARITSEQVTTPPIQTALITAPVLTRERGRSSISTPRSSGGLGPPLYVAQRALLI